MAEDVRCTELFAGVASIAAGFRYLDARMCVDPLQRAYMCIDTLLICQAAVDTKRLLTAIIKYLQAYRYQDLQAVFLVVACLLSCSAQADI